MQQNVPLVYFRRGMQKNEVHSSQSCKLQKYYWQSENGDRVLRKLAGTSQLASFRK